ncbi:MAG: tetratricopeptide repeat protein [Gammaproteobacteria bacterium]
MSARHRAAVAVALVALCAAPVVHAGDPVPDSGAADIAADGTAPAPAEARADIVADGQAESPEPLAPTAVAGVPLPSGAELILAPDDKAATADPKAAREFARRVPPGRLGAHNQVDLRLREIERLRREGHLDEAAVAAAEALRAAPQRRRLRMLAAELFTARGDYDQAIATLAPLLEQAGDWRAFFWAGTAYLMKGDPASAEVLLERACLLDSDRPEPWIARATIAQDSGRPRIALQYLQVAARLAPSKAEIVFNQAYAHEQLGERPAAMRLYRSYLALTAGDPSAASRRAWAGARLGADPAAPLPALANGR